jgi:RimJ/RimL family protein N-acetyltransferase
MSAPPKTVLDVTPAEASAIREAVRGADPTSFDASRRVARSSDGAALARLLADPRGSGPMSDLPQPIEEATVVAWVEECEAARGRGEAVLMVLFDEAGEVAGFSKVTVWPERSAAELAGALRADRQGAGFGGASAWRAIGWMFETLGVRLICLTADADNIRTARLIEAMGFVRLGERDGAHYWEMGREAWRAPAS